MMRSGGAGTGRSGAPAAAARGPRSSELPGGAEPDELDSEEEREFEKARELNAKLKALVEEAERAQLQQVEVATGGRGGPASTGGASTTSTSTRPAKQHIDWSHDITKSKSRAIG